MGVGPTFFRRKMHVFPMIEDHLFLTRRFHDYCMCDFMNNTPISSYWLQEIKKLPTEVVGLMICWQMVCLVGVELLALHCRYGTVNMLQNPTWLVEIPAAYEF